MFTSLDVSVSKGYRSRTETTPCIGCDSARLGIKSAVPVLGTRRSRKWSRSFSSSVHNSTATPILSTVYRACQTVLAALLEGLLPAIAPVLPHMAEDAWQAVPYPKPADSVFQASTFCAN